MIEQSLFGNIENNKIILDSVTPELAITGSDSILGLMDFNKMCYEENFRLRNYPEAVLCRMMYAKVMEAAKKQGLDVSEYPKELNYMELQN
jgi:hypothetical protein